MTDKRSKAASMSLLAKVEAARENRCRADLQSAEIALTNAASAALDAADRHRQMREQRLVQLAQRYGALPDDVRSGTDIQNLRAMEQLLTERQEAARQAQFAAQAAEKEAAAKCEQARDTLRVVSQRSLRRSRMAETLQREERQATMAAEEESVADELMDRASAMAATG